MSHPNEGIVYTETTVYSPPAQYASDAPYQIAIIDLENNDTGKQNRITVRILDEHAQIGDRVTFVESRNGVSYFRKAAVSPSE